MIQRKLNLDKENLEWFEEAFPDTSLSGIVNRFLESLHENMKEERTLGYNIDETAKQILRGEK